MNRTLFKRVVARSVAWAAAAALCGMIALAQDAAPASGQRTDGQIEMDVVHALDGSQALKNDLITAATIQGQVTLSGTVSSDASKQLAESIVKGVPGVSGVKNNLNVGNPANDPNAQGTQNSGQDDSRRIWQTTSLQALLPPPRLLRTTARMAASGLLRKKSAAPPSPDNGQASAAPAYGQPGSPGRPPGYGQPGSSRLRAMANPRLRATDRRRLRPTGPAMHPLRSSPPTGSPRACDHSAGHTIQLRTSESVDSKRAKGGEPVQFTVIQDVTLGGVLAIPRGATVHGVIADVRTSDRAL